MSLNILGDDYATQDDFAAAHNVHPRTIARYRREPNGLPSVEWATRFGFTFPALEIGSPSGFAPIRGGPRDPCPHESETPGRRSPCSASSRARRSRPIRRCATRSRSSPLGCPRPRRRTSLTVSCVAIRAAIGLPARKRRSGSTSRTPSERRFPAGSLGTPRVSAAQLGIGGVRQVSATIVDRCGQYLSHTVSPYPCSAWPPRGRESLCLG
jgi:hypothetical protein